MAEANQAVFYDQRLETLSREELRKLQQRRFRKLLQQVLESNSFYRQKFQAAGRPPPPQRHPPAAGPKNHPGSTSWGGMTGSLIAPAMRRRRVLPPKGRWPVRDS